MLIDHFRPHPGRAVELDQRARHSLADSIEAVFNACRGHLTAIVEDQAALLNTIRAHRVAPAVFAIYAELVEALFDEDDVASQRLMNMLLHPHLRDAAIARIITLDRDVLGDGVPNLYARTVDDDPTTSVRIASVDAAELARGRALHIETTRLLHAAAPDLSGEIGILAHETVLVRDDVVPGDATMGFDGASTFYLWGAVILNIERQHNRTGLAEALAHECGHAYLLGATQAAPLVDNDPAERFLSPLREDPRPMDGLVHASFVLARMVWCQDRMLECGLLNMAERAEVTAARARNRARFLDSEPLIVSAARFTEDGATLWHGAREWMAAGCPA